VDIAVVIKIAKRAAAARVSSSDARAGFVDQLLEFAVPQIAKDYSRCMERIGWQLLFHFRIDTAGHKENVRVAIIIKIEDPGAPSDETGLDAEAAANGAIVEGAFAVVAIENAGVIGEMRLENIQVAVQIEIADADSHSCLLDAVLIQRNAAF